MHWVVTTSIVELKQQWPTWQMFIICQMVIAVPIRIDTVRGAKVDFAVAQPYSCRVSEIFIFVLVLVAFKVTFFTITLAVQWLDRWPCSHYVWICVLSEILKPSGRTNFRNEAFFAPISFFCFRMFPPPPFRMAHYVHNNTTKLDKMTGY